MQLICLGPVVVVDGGNDVSMSLQLRRLLALLVIADGGVVSSDRIAEYVADGQVDGSTVRTAVSRLRKVVGDRVEHVGDGYRLVLSDGESDAQRFISRIESARELQPEDRVGVLREALGLWRGEILGELAGEEWAVGFVSRLSAARVSAVEDLGEALIESDRCGEAVELLESHVLAHPFRERPVGMLMRGLHAEGRTADGLRVFERFRLGLRDELGLDPSAELRSVESELLSPVEASSSPQVELPSGTVTFLFTDIEGSTARWADDEEAMAAALAAHDEVLRDAVASHGGVMFKHTGDGVCAAFASAPGAVGAAIDAQDGLELPVRMGLHTGEAELRDGDYFGPTLNRVARIMDAGHGGQILMSSATAGLVRDAVVTTDLGRHRLKGLSTLEQIVQVGTTEFPPLRAASARTGNLPTENSPFVGRSEELSDLAGRLLDHRLVTLLGVGGTGKTRLAVETAEAVAPAFPDGCWMVELAPISTPGAVPFSLAIGLGVQPPEVGDVLDHVIGRIKHQRRLVIVDNCEHLTGATADAVERLLAGCPTLTILTTSREALMVRGEQLVPIASLSETDAEALFLGRAHDEAPDALLDEHQLDAVHELCERLDRLPLAIELAASRLRVMTPVEMLAGIDERFRLLTGGRRSRMERHQTMRGTVDWSYELCDDVERTVFDRLSVFVTAFDLDAAVAVASDDAIGRFGVIDALEQLVERSMVQRITTDNGTSRFSMLETMRAYGREHLADQGAADEIRERHAHRTAATIAALSLRSYGPDEAAVLAEIRRLVPELLPALDWCIEHHDWSRAVRLTAIRGAVQERIVNAVAVRLEEAILAAEGDLDVLGRHERHHLFICRHGTEGVAVDEAIDTLVQNELALIRGDAPMVTDCLLVVPYWLRAFYIGTVPTPGDFARLEVAPAVLRYLARFDTVLGLIQRDAGHADPDSIVPGWLHDELRALIDTLDSERARRQALGLRSFQAMMAEDYPEMLRCSEAALPHDDLADAPDIDAAFRHLRALAVLQRTPTGAELRRPWAWIQEGGFYTPLFHALHTTAAVMMVNGFVDLRDRLLAVARHTGGDELWAWLERNLRVWLERHASGPTGTTYAVIAYSEFAQHVRATIASDEDLDTLITDVFEVADEFDRRAAAEASS